MSGDGFTIALEYFRARRTLGKLETRRDIERFHQERVRILLGKVLPDSPYYSALYQGLDHDGWEQFPMTSKDEWMGNFDKVNTLGITLKEAFEIARQGESTRDFRPTIKGVTVGMSSGTSGNKGVWLVSHEERCRWVANVLLKHFPKGLLSKERVALFLRANSNLYRSMGRCGLKFRYFDLQDPFESVLREVNEYAPTVMAAPPSMLLMMVACGGLKVRPKKIISVADVLDRADEIRLERYFGCKIDQFYMATEGFIATTCREGTLHVNEDLMAVQEDWIDRETGRYAPVITDLQRFIQPVIRYRLNDVLVQGGECGCGSPFKTISRIEGRQDDVLYYPDEAGRLVAIFPDFIRNAIVSSGDEIRDYSVRQRDYATLDVYLDRRKPSSLDVRSVFAGKCRIPEINYYWGVPKTNVYEKMRRVRREIVQGDV